MWLMGLPYKDLASQVVRDGDCVITYSEVNSERPAKASVNIDVMEL